MSVPDSVMKIKKTKGSDGYELTFTSSVDRVNYTLKELITRANKDVGKYLVKIIHGKVKGIGGLFRMKGSTRHKRYQYWARRKEGDLIIGVENTSKGAVSAWWADQAELGTNSQPKRGFIYETVQENIDQIREIQSQYLSAINNEPEAVALANENESVPDGQNGGEDLE